MGLLYDLPFIQLSRIIYSGTMLDTQIIDCIYRGDVAGLKTCLATISDISTMPRNLSIMVMYATHVDNNRAMLQFLVEELQIDPHQSIQNDRVALTNMDLTWYPLFHALIYTARYNYWTSKPNTNPMMEACNRGHEQNVRYLMSVECRVDTVDDKGLTPIYYMAKYGCMGIIPEMAERTGRYVDWNAYMICISDRYIRNKKEFQKYMAYCPDEMDVSKFFVYVVRKNRYGHLKPASHYFQAAFSTSIMDQHANNLIHLAVMAMDEKDTGDMLDSLVRRSIQQNRTDHLQMNEDGYTPRDLTELYHKPNALNVLRQF